MPRIMSRSDLLSKKKKRHSTSCISINGESSSYSSHNATWSDYPAHRANAEPLSSPNLLNFTRQTEQTINSGNNRSSRNSLTKGDIQTQQAPSPGSTYIGTSCENSIMSERSHNNTIYSSSLSSKSGSFIPRVSSVSDDWGQYVDVCESSSSNSHLQIGRRKPEWKKYFH